MNTSLIVIIGLFLLTLTALAGSLYAISLIWKRKYKTHIKIQNILFFVVTAGVIIFEIQLRSSGGSGSLVEGNPLTETTFFKGMLLAHIIGAVLTFILWGATIILSNRKYKRKRSLGVFTSVHRKMGYMTVGGLFYTVVTAFIICTMAFLL